MTEMVPVDSSLVSLVGYNEATKELFVTLKSNNMTYVYEDIPKGVYQQFLSAKSVGSFFAKNIKPNFVYSKAFVEG